jgi:hypothetical protein
MKIGISNFEGKNLKNQVQGRKHCLPNQTFKVGIQIFSNLGRKNPI